MACPLPQSEYGTPWESGPKPPPWQAAGRAEWFHCVNDWVCERLGEARISLTGPFEVVREQPWGITLRFRAAGYPVYFKASGLPGRHEAAVIGRLSQDWSDRVPAPLALDERRGWLLTRDCGNSLRHGGNWQDTFECWRRLLPQYAELQLGTAMAHEHWLTLGLPDRRLECLPGLLEELLHRASSVCLGQPHGLSEEERQNMLLLIGRLQTCCQELSALAPLAALDHGDLQADNVVGKAAQWRIIDWADACWTHPFCSLVVTFNSLREDFSRPGLSQRMRDLRDAYLEPWGRHGGDRMLRRAFPLALWVGHVVRALDWNHLLSSADAAKRRRLQPNVVRWLKLWSVRRKLLLSGHCVS